MSEQYSERYAKLLKRVRQATDFAAECVDTGKCDQTHMLQVFVILRFAIEEVEELYKLKYNEENEEDPRQGIPS